ncbi:hypothetical protein A2U01_0075618, partial [Trifolium medium]|nr:hypothetical protein [Trifolium medium]
IFIRAIASIESVDSRPESFLITTELTWTIESVDSSNPLGISAFSGRIKQSIVTFLSCDDSRNL